MDAAAFVATIRSAWADWQSALEGLSAEAAALPGACGSWSVIDLVAHVTWYEREMVGLLRHRALAGHPWWELALDDRNERIRSAARNLTWLEALAKMQAAHGELTGLVEGLSDQELVDARTFGGMPADWTPEDVLAGNTYEHYPEHAAQIVDWKHQREAKTGRTS